MAQGIKPETNRLVKKKVVSIKPKKAKKKWISSGGGSSGLGFFNSKDDNRTNEKEVKKTRDISKSSKKIRKDKTFKKRVK